MNERFYERRTKFCLVVLVGLTLLFLVWPLYRSFLNIEIDTNEGWNAYFADAALGRMPLYPEADQLITNNYPPLSFYVVGGVGNFLQDRILAGRLLSLLSIGIITLNIALSIRQLGGTAQAACLGSFFYTATMLRFFTCYAGMNDPQLLAHAIMSFGFLLFLRARNLDSSLVWPVIIMVVAGFFKHNIVAMPLTLFLWLALTNRKQMIQLGLLAALAIAGGFLACYVVYGHAFLENLLAPRVTRWQRALNAIGHLQWVSVALVTWCYVGFTRRTESNANLCSLLIAVSFVNFFLQKTGEGVAHNAQFDLLIALAIGLGLAFSRLAFTPLAVRYSPSCLQGLLVILICTRLLISTRLEPLRVLVDSSFRTKLTQMEQRMHDKVLLLREHPGEVAGSTYASYRSGKPFTVDLFNTAQRIRKGKLSRDIITQRISEGLLLVDTETRHD